MSKFYVTTSIVYVNSDPHIGFAMELIQADVLARYHRGQGADVKFVTGTDEHGAKIYRTAKTAGVAPAEFVATMSAKFQNLQAALGLSFDRFIRTSSAEHHAAAQALWRACQADIYTATYDGLYCVGCEAYYTPTDAPGGLCPIHHTKLEQYKEDNYFFKASKYGPRIKELITANQFVIQPETRRNEILALLDHGLADISISRSKANLPWGVDVPGDPNQVMYVWFDALSNYISALDYPDGADFAAYWPADVQVIGKDILRFHAAIWPAMLLSAGLPLPRALYVHGFIESDGHKMSKSLGNVIDPMEVVKKYGPDPLRYYLLSQIPWDADGDFTWDRFERVYNTDLANDLGNLVQRVAVMVQKYLGGKLSAIPPSSHDAAAYDAAITNFQFDRALDAVWTLVRGLNQFVEAEKPWELAKTDPKHLAEVLGYAVSDLRQIASLLAPVLPDTAAKIEATFKNNQVDPKVGILFPRLGTAAPTHTRFNK